MTASPALSIAPATITRRLRAAGHPVTSRNRAPGVVMVVVHDAEERTARDAANELLRQGYDVSRTGVVILVTLPVDEAAAEPAEASPHGRIHPARDDDGRPEGYIATPRHSCEECPSVGSSLCTPLGESLVFATEAAAVAALADHAAHGCQFAEAAEAVELVEEVAVVDLKPGDVVVDLKRGGGRVGVIARVEHRATTGVVDVFYVGAQAWDVPTYPADTRLGRRAAVTTDERLVAASAIAATEAPTAPTCPACGQSIAVTVEGPHTGYSECGGEGEGGCPAWIGGDAAAEAAHAAAVATACLAHPAYDAHDDACPTFSAEARKARRQRVNGLLAR